jgi:MIP family channel proteins
VEQSSLGRKCVAEAVGTYILVLLGVGSVHAAVLTGAQVGIWQVAVVWGGAVAMAIYAAGAVSGAHINPAITVAMAAFRGFPLRRVPAYVLSQLLGAVLAAGTLYVLFGGVLGQFEHAAGLVRGQAGSELSAMVYGEYFPNPATAQAMKWTPHAVTHAGAMLAEGIGTAFLAFVVFAVTDPRNAGRPGRRLRPLLIGLAVAAAISVIAPLTQAGLNPARDFGPRLFAYFAGWGPIAIPGPRGGFFTVYILAPILGALTGAGAYQYLIRPAMSAASEAKTHVTTIRRIAMPPVQLILVGGFLGSGKTTLLWQAATRLAAAGKRVGLITNDQAADLVDTGLLTEQGMNVREVAGSCFCCNFPALIAAAESLRSDVRADVLVAEPVGSCTDLSATLLQPLKDKFAQDFVLSPLSVLADPQRLREVLVGVPGRLHDSAAYIIRKQLEEADVIVLNKTDLLSPAERGELLDLVGEHFPAAEVRCLSALTGQGVDDWLQAVLAAGATSGGRIAEVDYDTYAEGEAVLGWLNAAIDLTGTAGGEPPDWRAFCLGLMVGLGEDCRRRGVEVGHVKCLLTAGGGRLVANLTRTDGQVALRGEIPHSANRSALVLNARVQMPPEELESLVRARLRQAAGSGIAADVTHLRSLSPGRPNPTHRYDRLVEL